MEEILTEEINLDTYQFLKEHSVNHMPIVPGAFLGEKAVELYSRECKRLPKGTINMQFYHPIFLNGNVSEIKIETKKIKEQARRYTFFMTGNEEIVLADVIIQEQNTEFEEDEFTDFEFEKGNSEAFYDRLDKEGNNYGESFRKLMYLSKEKNNMLGEMELSDEDLQNRYYTILIDVMCHSLLQYKENSFKAYILSEIGECKIVSQSRSKHIMIGISNLKKQEDSICGDIKAYDKEKNCLLVCLKGVKFKAFYNQNTPKINISSNFTVEPLKDVMDFWITQTGEEVEIAIAQYNQVFQELINKNSFLYDSNTEFNVLVLSLEEWYRQVRYKNKICTNADEIFQGLNHYILPNSMEIVHCNKYETDYIYNEMFEEEIYFKHGITLCDGDTVIDIGANIGLFMLYVNSMYDNVRVYSYEPSPVVYEVLNANAKAYGSNLYAFNFGVSDCKKCSDFTFYENSTVFSTFYSDEKEEQKAIQAIVKNMIIENIGNNTKMDSYVEQMMQDRLKSKCYQVEMVSVSDIINSNGIKEINLLKIDAEKSELDVLRGIQECDWPKIKQIVMEIHDDGKTVLSEIKHILEKRGFTYELEQDNFLENSGLYNLYAVRNKENECGKVTSLYKALDDNRNMLCNSLDIYFKQNSIPLLVAFTPSSKELSSNHNVCQMIRDIEQMLIEYIDDRCICMRSNEVLENYKISEYFDYETRKLGHIPYTLKYFTGLGSQIYRRYVSLKKEPKKVLILDCDNTMWKGICGENEKDTLQLTEGMLAIQKYALKNKENGVLLCLCSKNNYEDVYKVFQNRNDMLLKWDDFVLKKINWRPKSENIIEICNELELGYDSVIFMDDSALECEEVKQGAPGVVTICISDFEEKNIDSILNNLWIFDQISITNEDRNRTDMYRNQFKRNDLMDNTDSVEKFIEQLNLKVEIKEIDSKDVDRFSQLTLRTNQFNFATVRCSVSDIYNIMKHPETKCFKVQAKDKFGDYGLAGGIIVTWAQDKFVLENMLLSCRALGRGIEYMMLSFVGELASQMQFDSVQIKFYDNEKNVPAKYFLDSVCTEFKKDINSYVEKTNEVKNLTFTKAEKRNHSTQKKIDRDKVNLNHDKSRIIDITKKYYNIEKLEHEIFNFSDLEIIETEEIKNKLFFLWKRVLKLSTINEDDNFFDIGGDSLSALFVIAEINKTYGTNFSVVSMVEMPTIRIFHNKLSAITSEDGKQDVEIENKERINNAIHRGKRKKRQGK